MLEDRLQLGSTEYQRGSLKNLNLTPNAATDRCVAAVLWDIFDPQGREIGAVRDRVSLPFSELFRVYSPSLQILTSGPVINNIYDFAARIKENNARSRDLPARIDEALALNVGALP